MVRPVSYSSVGKKSTEGAFVLPRIRGRNINVERRAVPRTAQRWRVPQVSLSVSLFLVALFVSMSSAGCVCLELLCQIPSCSPPGKKSFLLEALHSLWTWSAEYSRDTFLQIKSSISKINGKQVRIQGKLPATLWYWPSPRTVSTWRSSWKDLNLDECLSNLLSQQNIFVLTQKPPACDGGGWRVLGGRFQGATAWVNYEALVLLRENYIWYEDRADSEKWGDLYLKRLWTWRELAEGSSL